MLSLNTTEIVLPTSIIEPTSFFSTTEDDIHVIDDDKWFLGLSVAAFAIIITLIVICIGVLCVGCYCWRKKQEDDTGYHSMKGIFCFFFLSYRRIAMLYICIFIYVYIYTVI